MQFSNGSLRLAGTLSLPKDCKVVGAIVLVGGSGPNVRDDQRFHADHFARNGVATLIYDKRGAGESQGSWKESSFDDLADDAIAGLQLVKFHEPATAGKIGLMGFSEGSWVVGPAAARSRDVAFVVTESGGGVTFSQQLRYMYEMQLTKAGVSKADVQTGLELVKKTWKYGRTQSNWEEVEAAVDPFGQERWIAYLPMRMKKEHWYWKYLRLNVDYDPAPAIEKLNCPLLVILGEADASTPPQATADRLEQLLSKTQHLAYESKIFPGADHSLCVRVGLFPKLAPGYFEMLDLWISKQFEANIPPTSCWGPGSRTISHLCSDAPSNDRAC